MTTVSSLFKDVNLNHILDADVIVKKGHDKADRVQAGIHIDDTVDQFEPLVMSDRTSEVFNTPQAERSMIRYPDQLDFIEGENLYDHFLNNPLKYPIGNDGKLLRNSGKPYKSSDIGEIIYHYFHRGKPGQSSPVGYPALR